MPHPIRAIAALRLWILAAVSWCAPWAVEAQVQATPTPEFQALASAMTIDPGVTCLDSKELVEHISSWLGTDRVSAALAIEVHGSPYFARTVSFRIQRANATIAERRFDPAPARCADQHAAVGLAIALALKASLLDSLIGARTRDDAHASGPTFRIIAQALSGLAVVPGADFGVGLSLQRAVAQRFAARLSVLGMLGPYGDFQQDQGRFKTWLSIGRFDICSRLAELGNLGVSACVGFAGGGLYATGEAFPMSRHTLITYLAVANALELDLELNSHWSLSLAINVLVPLRRTSFVVRDQDGAVIADNDLASAGALIALGPAFRF